MILPTPRRLCAMLAALFVITLSTQTRAAPTRPFTDDLGRLVHVPEQPQRIVSLHDLDITIPLLELGVRPVASHGRQGLDGKRFMRSSASLIGIDFDNSDIAFLGEGNVSLEAVAAARPDLIITDPARALPVAQLAQIAPTVMIDNLSGGAPHIYQRLAELTGTQAQWAVLEYRYQAQLAELRQALGDPARYQVSVLQAQNGKISVHHTYRSLGRVLRNVGVRFPAIIDAIPVGGRIEISAERLQELDADFIFDTYRSAWGAGPDSEIAAMNAVMPNYCQFLKACREGRYILVAREEVISNSYAALSLMVSLVKSHLTGRPIPVPNK